MFYFTCDRSFKNVISGEVLRLKQLSSGVDVNSTLQTDIIVTGHVPVLSETSSISILPYVEHFVQVAAGMYVCTVCTIMTSLNELFLTDMKRRR